MQLEINKEAVAGIYKPLSLSKLVVHYQSTELADSNPNKTAATKDVYRHHLNSRIVPKW